MPGSLVMFPSKLGYCQSPARQGRGRCGSKAEVLAGAGTDQGCESARGLQAVGQQHCFSMTDGSRRRRQAASTAALQARLWRARWGTMTGYRSRSWCAGARACAASAPCSAYARACAAVTCARARASAAAATRLCSSSAAAWCRSASCGGACGALSRGAPGGGGAGAAARCCPEPPCRACSQHATERMGASGGPAGPPPLCQAGTES